MIDGLTAEQARAIMAAVEECRTRGAGFQTGQVGGGTTRGAGVRAESAGQVLSAGGVHLAEAARMEGSRDAELERLRKLLKDGLITEEEYNDYLRRHGISST